MQTKEHDSLTAALGVRPCELVSLVGGGGKSGALQLLALEAMGSSPAQDECAGPGCVLTRNDSCDGAGRPRGRVLATTTTAMFLGQLRAVGPVLFAPARSDLLAALPSAMAPGGAVAAARDLGEAGKVEGLPPEWVDEAWAAGIADLVLVEADGSKGLSFKAFGPHEPQVPSETTLIVQVAGLDALGAPLDEAHVHRAAMLMEALSAHAGAPPAGAGAEVTSDLFLAALRLQLCALRGRWPAARIVTLLNKADDEGRREAGRRIAGDLLSAVPGGVAPEAVVVGAVQRRSFTRLTSAYPLVSAIVLAAGRASRMGAQKVLLPVGGRPMVHAVAEAAARSLAAEVIVVVGSEAEPVRAVLAECPMRIVDNPGYGQGMSTSLRAGLAAARPDADAVLFVLGDQPFVTPEVIDRLIQCFAERASGIVRPVAGGVPAHPVLLGAEHFPEILALEGDVGAREIVARHPDEVAYVEVTDARLVMDLDTPEDYQTATGR